MNAKAKAPKRGNLFFQITKMVSVLKKLQK